MIILLIHFQEFCLKDVYEVSVGFNLNWGWSLTHFGANSTVKVPTDCLAGLWSELAKARDSFCFKTELVWPQLRRGRRYYSWALSPEHLKSFTPSEILSSFDFLSLS